MDLSEATALLGAAAGEIVDVVEEAFGHVIKHRDGSSYVAVAADKPDAAGKTGLMYLTAPTPTYEGTFPVFAPSAGAPDPAPAPPEPAADQVPAPDTAPEAPAAAETAAADEPAGAEPAAAVPVKGKSA